MKTFLSVIHILIVILVSKGALSQNEFIPGTIITSTYDTVETNLSFKSGKKTPKAFKKEDSMEEFTADSVSEVLIHSKNLRFVSREVSLFRVNDNPLNSEFFSKRKMRDEGLDPDQHEGKRIFLKLLSDNYPKLYVHTDVLNVTHFFVETDSLFTEIYQNLYRKTQYIVVHKPATAMHYQFILVLGPIMKSCFEAMHHLQTMKFNEDELIKLFAIYKNCNTSN